MLFNRLGNSPFVSRTPGTFYSRLVANPDILEFREKLYFFFRGQGDEGHDQIGLWSQSITNADGLTWDTGQNQPVIEVSTSAEAHDSDHILDPAATVFDDAIYLYYTAKSVSRKSDYSIALARSRDGVDFEKYVNNPILPGAISPEVIQFQGLVYLFFQRHNAVDDYWEVFCRTSEDGINFPESSEKRVFGPSRIIGTFDSHSVATIRIFQEGDYFYMSFGACQKFLDYPESIGLARSSNLIEWEHIPGGAIFSRGNPGSWDEGAVWFPTIHRIKDRYFMWYEGAGTGLGVASESAKNASNIARDENYGGYLIDSFSQIGLAFSDEDISQWR